MLKKKLNKHGQKKGNSLFNLTVFDLLRKGSSPKEIGVILNISLPAVSYHLRKLRASGSIRKLGYGTWETLKYSPKEVKQITVGDPLTLKKNCLTSFLKSSPIRGHGFRFRVKIPKLKNWDKREDYLIKNKIKYDVINSGHTHRIMVRGSKVWLNSSSIVVYFPKGLSFFGETAGDTEERAFFEIIDLMDNITSRLNVSLKINKSYHIKIFGKHQSNIGNTLAKVYNREGRTLKVSNKDGLWLLIDDSFNLNELETVGVTGNNDSTTDMDDVVMPFFNSLKTHPFTSKDFHRFAHLVGDHLENEHLYIENIRSHLNAIKDISKYMGNVEELLKEALKK